MILQWLHFPVRPWAWLVGLVPPHFGGVAFGRHWGNQTFVGVVPVRDAVLRDNALACGIGRPRSVDYADSLYNRRRRRRVARRTVNGRNRVDVGRRNRDDVLSYTRGGGVIPVRSCPGGKRDDGGHGVMLLVFRGGGEDDVDGGEDEDGHLLDCRRRIRWINGKTT